MTKPFYIDTAKTRDEIYHWVRNEDGTVSTVRHDIGDYSYCFIPANDGNHYPYKDLFGRMVKPVYFNSPWELRSYSEDHPSSLESDVQPINRFMMDEFHDADIEWPYRLAFYDIEVDFDLSDGNGYPTPENPFGEINSIQIFDTHKQEYVLFLPQKKANVIHLTDEEFHIEIVPTLDERDMLELFAEYIKEFDFIGGWYTAGFDLPYIMERAIYQFGRSKALTMFCRDGFEAKSREYINSINGKEEVDWTLIGIQHFDMLELYKKFNPGEKPNFKLDTICELEGVGRKVDYDGDLGELYRTNPQKFYEYAIHDVRLLKDLDIKTDTMKLAITMSRESCVAVKDVSSTVKPIENGFMIHCKKEGIILPNKKKNQKQKFPGAIVYDTINGVHKWATSFDLTALYPSVMIMLGLSTETLVMQVEEGYDGFIAVVTESDEIVNATLEDTLECIPVTGKELNQIIKENGYTISANGTIFDGSLGLLSAYVKSVFNKRVEQKRLAKEYFNAGDKANGTRYDLFQKVTKIRANSLYGCIGNEHFRLFDLRMAKSITLTGQMISKHQAIEANKITKGWVL